jgi:hypothetical protein
MMQWALVALLVLVLAFVAGCARIRGAARDAYDAVRPPLASCYIPAPTITEVYYICPTCGERTVYVASKPEGRLALKMASLGVIGANSGLRIDFEAHGLCHHCDRRVKPARLDVLIRYDEDGETERIEGITPDDVDKLIALVYGYGPRPQASSFSSPLCDRVPRIVERLPAPRDEPGAATVDPPDGPESSGAPQAPAGTE